MHKTDKSRGVIKYVCGVVSLGIGIVSSILCMGLTVPVTMQFAAFIYIFFTEGAITDVDPEFVENLIMLTIKDVILAIVAIISFMCFIKIYRSFKKEKKEEGI